MVEVHFPVVETYFIQVEIHLFRVESSPGGK